MKIALIIGLLLICGGYVIGKQIGRREQGSSFANTSNISTWNLLQKLIKRKTHGMEGRIGILSSDLVFARSGPGREYENAGVFRIGELIKILNDNSNWFYVQLYDGRKGWVLKQYCAEYYGDPDYPAYIILHQAMEGDLRTNLVDCCVNPKKELTLYVNPDVNSQEVKRLIPNNYYSIIDFELHTFPRYNGFTMPNGETFTALAYRGEGFYSVLFDDGIIETVDIGTENLKLRTRPELWLHLKVSESITGWLKVEERDDWNLGPLTINSIGDTDFVEEEDDWLDWNKQPYEGLLWKENKCDNKV